MSKLLDNNYDTLTLEQWKRMQAEEPLSPPSPSPATDQKAPNPCAGASTGASADSFERSCESCGAHIPFDADPRRRYCSASCRAIASKRRNALQPSYARNNQAPVSWLPSGSDLQRNGEADLEAISKVACSLLARNEVNEVEIRIMDVSVIIKR